MQVKFIDKNFLGLGQKLKLSCSLSDNAFDPGAAASLVDMRPVCNFEWNDWGIGPGGDDNFGIRVHGESRSTNIKRSRLGFDFLSSMKAAGVCSPTTVSTITTSLSRYCIVRDILLSNDDVAYHFMFRYFPHLFCDVSVAPFSSLVTISEDSKAADQLVLSGAKSTISFQSKVIVCVYCLVCIFAWIDIAVES